MNCLPCCADITPLRVSIDNDCNCNCSSSCCLPFLRKRRNNNQDERINEIVQQSIHHLSEEHKKENEQFEKIMKDTVCNISKQLEKKGTENQERETVPKRKVKVKHHHHPKT